jgi:integrase
MAQLATLSRAIDDLKGHMKNAPSVSRKDFWRAFVSLGYYAGLRLGDLMKLDWQQHIGDDGSLNIVMGKTGDLLTTRLPADCLARLEPLKAAGTPLVFGDILNRKNLQLFFRRILRNAGLPGSVKWLRRTGASHLEAVHRGAAKDHLGHRTHGLAYKHYVDPRVVQQEKPLPPRLEFGADS